MVDSSFLFTKHCYVNLMFAFGVTRDTLLCFNSSEATQLFRCVLNVMHMYIILLRIDRTICNLYKYVVGKWLHRILISVNWTVYAHTGIKRGKHFWWFTWLALYLIRKKTTFFSYQVYTFSYNCIFFFFFEISTNWS